VFDDVDLTIQALLKSELPSDIASQVSISFATPDDSYPPSDVNLPAINFFLFEIHENAELRTVEPLLERAADGSMQRTPSPYHIDCHYLVTAVAPAVPGGPDKDEHRILGATLRVLLRHRELPAAVLQGTLAGTTPPLRGNAARQGAHPSGIDLWQAIKGKPRAAIHYTITVPMDVATSADVIARPALALDVGGT
jgi:hypothetical protein